MFLLYCGTSLNGGVALERKRYSNGILIPDFFLTYLLATKVDSWFQKMYMSNKTWNKSKTSIPNYMRLYDSLNIILHRMTIISFEEKYEDSEATKFHLYQTEIASKMKNIKKCLSFITACIIELLACIYDYDQI